MLAGIAASFIVSQAAQLQQAVATSMLKMNASAGSDSAKMLDSAAQPTNSLANVASGIGANLNISA
jgi:hypothetical protein